MEVQLALEEGPSSKRQRLPNVTPPAEPEAPSVQQQSPCLTALFQVPAALPREASPGAAHGCRIAAWYDPHDSSNSTYGSVLASGRHVYWSQLHVQHAGQLQPEQHGKEGVMLPLRLQTPAVTRLEQLPQHAGEVQSLALCRCPTAQHPSQQLLATVDAYGTGSITALRPVSDYAHAAAGASAAGGGSSSHSAAAVAAAALAASAGPEVVVLSALAGMAPCREGGWAGVAFSGSSSSTGSSSPSLLATARCYAKDLCIYDVSTGKALRSNLSCVQNPHALAFLPPGVLGAGADKNLLAVAEGHLVSVWDLRTAGAAGGCVQRFSPGALGSPLYSLAWSAAQGGLLGTAGAERSLYLCEPRKWRAVAKWHSPTRLDIFSVAFLDSDPHVAVLAGLDLEVVVGRWDAPGSSNAARPFESGRRPEAGPEGAANAGGSGEGGEGEKPLKHAAPGAPGSGDRSRPSSSSAASAAAAAAAAMDVMADVDEPAAAAAAAGALTFRGDGRWLGVAKASGADVLAGFAASGSLVYARLA